MIRGVAIVGAAESRAEAPFNDPAWEIWSLNNIYPMIPRRSRWFELHHIHFDGADYYRKGSLTFRGISVNQYLHELNNLGCPVYMQSPWGIIEKSVRFPLETVLKNFKRYFTSSIAYMLALAMLEGHRKIGIYGVNMSMDDEYRNQRPCLEYILGLAEGEGIEILLPKTSGLLYAPSLYGYDFNFELEMVKQKIKERFFKNGS